MEANKDLKFLETLDVNTFKKTFELVSLEGGCATKKDGTLTEKFCACIGAGNIVKFTIPVTKEPLTKPVVSRVISTKDPDAKEFYLLHNQGEIVFTGDTFKL